MVIFFAQAGSSPISTVSGWSANQSMDEPSLRDDPFKGRDPFAATNGEAADPFKEDDPFKSGAPEEDPFKGSKSTDELILFDIVNLIWKVCTIQFHPFAI